MTSRQTSSLSAVADPSNQRGDRLRPRRTSRIYWHLTCLRNSLAGVIERHVAGRSIELLVDYGCGDMPYRPLFAPHLIDYRGADLADNPAATIALALDGSLPLESETADLALSTQVLEHVESPEAYLRECHRVLKTNGKLILSTHGVWRYHPDPTDYWRWTCDGLKKIVAQAGFDILEFRGIMAPASLALQLLQDAIAPAVPRVGRPLFYAGMQALVQAADVVSSAKTRDREAAVFLLVASKANTRPSEQ